MLLSYHHSNFGDSDDVTTTEHDCGAATGRRLKISGVMAGMVGFLPTTTNIPLLEGVGGN